MFLNQYTLLSKLLLCTKNTLANTKSINLNKLSNEMLSRSYRSAAKQQAVLEDLSKVKNEISHSVIAKVNHQIVNKSHGRLFAVVYITGQQFKITTEDLVVIRGPWGPTAGDKIRLEKVLLVGSSDFTLIGRPLLPFDQVSVLATVIEKTYTHAYPLFRYRNTRNYMKLNFRKDELTFLRITDISIKQKVNESNDVDGLKDRIF